MRKLFYIKSIVLIIGGVVLGYSRGFSQEKTRFLLSLDTKKTLFAPVKYSTVGIRMGVKYGCRVNVGFGVYSARNIDFDYRLDPIKYPDASTSTQAKITYITTFVEPIILSDKKKIFSTPISLGGGIISAKYKKFNSIRKTSYFSAFAPVLEISGVGMVKVIPFVWVGFGVGYRHFFYAKDDYVDMHFNSPFYMLKLKIGRPCKEAGFFYKWRKKTFGNK